MPERLMIAEKLPVLRVLLGPVLALPSKFVIGQEMVGVSMIRAHVLFRQRDQKEDLRISNDEPAFQIAWLKARPNAGPIASRP